MRTTRYFLKQSITIRAIPCVHARSQSCVFCNGRHRFNRPTAAFSRLLSVILSYCGSAKQYKRCPGGAEVRASDGSNVLSAEQQQQLDCTESARASGAYAENSPSNNP